MDNKNRCFGNGVGKAFYAKYHDEEWAIPVYDDQKLFEMLILEGAQAGLSWEIILKKRAGYQKAFYNFDVKKVAKMADDELEKLRENPQIVRNRLKIYATKKNAQIFLEIQKEFGSFNKYIWGFVNENPIQNNWKSFAEIPVRTVISDQISKDLKKRGMGFVGSTIIYAFMQAIGMVDDHLINCWKRNF